MKLALILSAIFLSVSPGSQVAHAEGCDTCYHDCVEQGMSNCNNICKELCGDLFQVDGLQQVSTMSSDPGLQKKFPSPGMDSASIKY